MDVYLRDEQEADQVAVRALHRQAFERDDEGQLVDALRAGGYVDASLVAVKQDILVGHVLFSRLEIEGPAHPLRGSALAPVSVLPTHQRRGIGANLVRAGLARCRRSQIDVVLVLGSPAYYQRFGFRLDLASAFECTYAGPHWMACELTPGILAGISGRVMYPPPFETNETRRP